MGKQNNGFLYQSLKEKTFLFNVIKLFDRKQTTCILVYGFNGITMLFLNKYLKDESLASDKMTLLN